MSRAVLLGLGALLGCLMAVAVTPSAQALDADKFFALTVKAAQASEKSHDVPTSVSLAQAALESGWGESALATKGNAYFGIKCKTDNGPYATGCMDKKTTECNSSGCFPVVARFRTYDSMADSFADHGHFLASRTHYAAAFKTDNPDDFIRAVHKGGYATDPAYSDKIINLMVRYNLYRYDLGNSSPTLKLNDTGAKVTEAQRELIRHGYAISATGVFGPKTQATVRTFQSAKRLGVSGVIGPVTWSALRGAVTASYPTLELNDTGTKVTEAQRLLIKHGYSLTTTGVFGPRTQSQVRAFQSDSGLGVSGVVGPVTWSALLK